MEFEKPSYDKAEPKEELPPVEIPLGVLSADALNGVIDSFIQREGTDYGVVEAAYETKVNQVRKQLDKGEVKIVFDPNTESVSLLTLRDWKKFQSPR